MTTPNILPGEGTLLKMSLASTMTTIGQVTKIDGPEVMINAIPTAHLTSTVMITRPSKLPTPKSLTFTIWYDPNDTTMHKLIADRVKTPGTIDDFEIWFVDGNTTKAKAGFSGFFTKVKPGGMEDEQNISADCEVQLTTAVTTTVGIA